MVHPALARALPMPLLVGIENSFAFAFAFALELLHRRRDSGVRVRAAEEGRQARDLPVALAFGADTFMQRDMGSDKGCNRSTLRILNPVEGYLSVSRFQQIFAGQRALLLLCEEYGDLMRPVVERQRVQSNQDWERGSI